MPAINCSYSYFINSNNGNKKSLCAEKQILAQGVEKVKIKCEGPTNFVILGKMAPNGQIHTETWKDQKYFGSFLGQNIVPYCLKDSKAEITISKPF